MRIPHIPSHPASASIAIVISIPLLFCSPYRVMAAENVVTCEPGQETSIQYGDIANCSIETVGDFDLFRFSGNIGEMIMVQAARLAGTVKPFVDVFAPDGTRIGGGLDTFQIGLEQTGPYTIQVTASGDDSTLDYALAVERILPPSPTGRRVQYDQTPNDSIDPVVDIDSFFFEATAGDDIRVLPIHLVFRVPPGVIHLDLFAPDGTLLDGGIHPFRVTLEQTGTYVIMGRSSFLRGPVVAYTLTLQCLSGDCVHIPVPDVSGCVAYNGSPLSGRKVDLVQSDEPTRTHRTDVRGCYKFNHVVPEKKFRVIVRRPVAK